MEHPAELHAFTCTEKLVPAARDDATYDVEDVEAIWAALRNTWYDVAVAVADQEAVKPDVEMEEIDAAAGAAGGDCTETTRAAETGEQPSALHAATAYTYVPLGAAASTYEVAEAATVASRARFRYTRIAVNEDPPSETGADQSSEGAASTSEAVNETGEEGGVAGVAETEADQDVPEAFLAPTCTS